MQPASRPQLRIAIRCNRRLFRDALASCLAACTEFTVVGQVADPEDLLQLCELSRPDVVLFDTGDTLPDDLEELKTLRTRFPGTAVVLAYDRLAPAEWAVATRCGVDTFVPCSHGLEALVAVLRQNLKRSTGGKEGLTELDREILALVAAGHSVERIAALLRVSKGTVENRKRRIYHKLHVSSQNQAVARATSLGLLAKATPAIATRAEGTTLAVLRGDAGLSRAYVMPALVEHGVPFIVDGPEFSYRGPVVLVLVDVDINNDIADVPPVPRILVRSTPMSRTEVLAALDSGISAVVDADVVPAEGLVAALTLAAQGHLVLAVPQARAVVGVADALRGEAYRSLPDLTARECDILRGIASGQTVRQTARELGIAEKTVENVQTRLFRKLGARNRTAALSVADALGLIEIEDQDRSMAANVSP
jgi:DNA-binding NarL/FixJ family response regulator